jgi:hypothetical protein
LGACNGWSLRRFGLGPQAFIICLRVEFYWTLNLNLNLNDDEDNHEVAVEETRRRRGEEKREEKRRGEVREEGE